MKILVFGAGAIGSTFGGFLSRTHDVTLLGRPAFLKSVRSRGLRITGIWGTHHFKRLKVETRPEVLRRRTPEFDLILVTVKSYDTLRAAKAVRKLIGPGTVVLPLQNGLGNIEMLARYVPKKQILAGRVIFGAVRSWPKQGKRGSARIKITVCAEPTAVGEPFQKQVSGRVRQYVRLFNKTGLETVAAADIRAKLWAKVIYNCALNPLASLHGSHYGYLSEVEPLRAVMDAVINEVYAVARKARVKLKPSRAEGYRRLFYAKLLPRTYFHRPSMLRDLLEKKRTEIDALNGAIVKLSRKYRVKAPVNASLTSLIHRAEK